MTTDRENSDMSPRVERPQDDMSAQTFARSRSLAFLLLLVSGIFLAGAIFLVISPGRSGPNVVTGTVSVVFCGAIFLLAAARLFDPRPIAVVTSRAIACPTLFDGDIAWSRIQKCEWSAITRPQILEFTIDRGPVSWRGPRSWIPRRAGKLPTFTLSSAMIAGSFDLLAPTCIAHVKAARAERARDPVQALIDRENDIAEAQAALADERLEMSRAAPFVTWGLTALLLAIFTLEMLIPATEGRRYLAPGLQILAKFRVLDPAAVREGEYFRLFSAALLHADIVQLVLNCTALLIVGLSFERYVGPAWFAATFALSALSGALLSLAINPATITFSGASSGIVGLLAATAIGRFHFSKGPTRSRLRNATSWPIAIILAPLTVAANRMQFDYAAHLGGAIAGGIVGGLLLLIWRPDQPRPRGRIPAMTLAAIFLLIGLYPIVRVLF